MVVLVAAARGTLAAAAAANMQKVQIIVPVVMMESLKSTLIPAVC